MTVSADLLQLIIYVATVLVALAPVVLVGLWLRDRKGGKIW